MMLCVRPRPPTCRDQRLFVLDTSNGRIVTKHVLEYGKVRSSGLMPQQC